MPIYEYQCTCGHVQDEFRTIDKRDKVPSHCGPMKRIISPTRCSPDIQAYWTVAADKETGKEQYITSRRQHREFLRRNDYIEIGNDSTIPKPDLERMREAQEAAKDPSRRYDNTIDALA